MLTEEYERKTIDLLLVSPLSFSEILTINGVVIQNIGLLLLLSGIVFVSGDQENGDKVKRCSKLHLFLFHVS